MSVEKLCSVHDCGRRHYGKGFCNAHYQQWSKQGRLPTGPVRYNRSNGVAAIRDEQGRKQCVACQLWLPEDKFTRHGATSDRKQVRCRSCAGVVTRVNQYRLSTDDIARIMREQEHKCAICLRDISGRYTVDHDHSCCPGIRSCGRCVRGFLCDGCNHGLGSFRDSVASLRAAIRYLDRCQTLLIQSNDDANHAGPDGPPPR